jgi:hypothetical protein
MLTYSLSRLGQNEVPEVVQQVVAFIIANRAEGIDDAATKADLLRMGHDEATVSAAFAQLPAGTPAKNGGNGGTTTKKRPWLWPAVIGAGLVGVIGIVAIARRG